MHSNNKLLDKISHYIIRRKGKQMRPMFVMLAAKTTGTISESTYVAASLIELLHTATLVHDDVVDDAQTRRGFLSINALWKNKIAVLVGDFLLSRGLLISVEKKEFNLLHIVSTAVREMSEGELLQQEKARLLNITEEEYFTIIRQKTASLIAACCKSGAASSGASEADCMSMYEFGIRTGIAFQIKDDLLDYGLGKDTGKPTGIDIQERKLTLPLIFALSKCSRKQRSFLINTIKKHNNDSTRVRELVSLVFDLGGIDYAIAQMNEYHSQALNILERFQDSPAKIALKDLLDYTINRNK